MLLFLIVFLMKFVDVSLLNRPRNRPGGAIDINSNCNSGGSSGSNSCTSSSNSNSSLKENNYFFGNYQQVYRNQQQNRQQQQQQHQQQNVMQITPHQYKELRYYRQLQEQQLYLLQRELLQREQSKQKQQHNHRKSSQETAPLRDTRNNEHLQNGRINSNFGSKNYRNFKGQKFRRGMTEFSLPNESHKSHLPQLNHTSPHHTNYPHSQNIYKRPLTSPNTPFNNCYGFQFTNSLANQQQKQQYQQQQQQSFGKQYLKNDCSQQYVSDLLNDEELTDESLKKNVQIVLNNLDRYNNALRSIILDEQLNSISFNNNMAGNMVTTPESDYNSNAAMPSHHPFGLNIGGGGGAGAGGGGGHLNCSIASSHDFTHDNSDYQWFLDYGYRDGVTHQSVLSSLSESYNGIGELSYYDDMAKNIDANLAEVDMESFRAEDIHSLLTRLPSFCKTKHSTTEIDNSICKSELLFSPVKESHISVDSLDLESYPDDGDIILTCKANKDNYTIAFEGSTLYSDESFYAEPSDINAKNKHNFINLHSNLDDIVKRKSLEVSMSRSDHAFTTWSKLKKSSTSQLQRYPSGNNNTSVYIVSRHAPHCNVRKSSSLPNLRLKKDTKRQLNVSQALSTSTVDSCKLRNLLPMCQMPISSTSGSESPVHHMTPSSSNSNDTSHIQSTDSTSQKQNVNQPAFNLVKLFIKHKSSSTETCMDVSSGCWPSTEGSASLERQRKKSMNDSGKGSALSRHEEEDDINNGDGDDIDPADSSYQLDSLDICDKSKNGEQPAIMTTPKKVKSDLYREVFESPMHRRQQPLKNPQVYNLTTHNNNLNNNLNNNNSLDCNQKSISSEATSRTTSENITQVYCSDAKSSSRMKIPVDMIARSMQTSGYAKDRLKFVPPSFLAKLNKLGEEKCAPVYVIYPSYALPDLGFVKTNVTDVILKPFKFKGPFGGIKKRPTSFTTHEDEENLKKVKYKQIEDWKSLATLLPIEYRKRLINIPEVDVELDDECSLKPLFCMSPPLRRNITNGVCDCAQFFQPQTTCTSSSGSGGSSQPPSSGYRGSSTLLTDSEFDIPVVSDPMKNMYVYQYDNNRMDNGELLCEKPPLIGSRTPRGILRKNVHPRTKRNSMHLTENSNVKNLEKRRSLQEPYFQEDEESKTLVDDYIPEHEEDQMRQYYNELHSNMQLNQTEVNLMMNRGRKSRKDRDQDARARAENFLSNVPKSELKFYAEIANILESTENPSVLYDAAKLKNEVSRALSQQKKVSFTQPTLSGVNPANYLTVGGASNKFSTPPNSPNISMAGLRVNNAGNMHLHIQHKAKKLSPIEQEKLNKISSNRFKRLQIQWELLSKDSSMMLKDLANEKETKSGGSTPTSANAPRSRIPRPVSYPASKSSSSSPVTPKQTSNLRPTSQDRKTIQSPSRLVPPKRYSVPSSSAAAVTTVYSATPNSTTTIITRARTPNNRTNTNNSNTSTPRKRVQSPRTITRTR